MARRPWKWVGEVVSCSQSSLFWPLLEYIHMTYAAKKVLSLEDAQSTHGVVTHFYCDYKHSRTQTPQTLLGDKQLATLSYVNL